MLDSGFNGPLGFGWTHTYLMHIVETADGLVNIFNPDGYGSFFKPNRDGSYNPPNGDFRILTKKPDGTFQIEEKSGTLIFFDKEGKLASIEDRNGNTLTLNYDASKLLKTIVDPSGQITTFIYAYGKLVSIIDPAGRTVSYEYSKDNLISVTDIGGCRTAYSYDSEHNMTAIAGPSGKRAFFTINADDRLERRVDEDGNNSLSYEYSKTLPEMAVTDAFGNQTTFSFDNNGLVTSIKHPYPSQIT